jgi:hypothetical protein
VYILTQFDYTDNGFGPSISCKNGYLVIITLKEYGVLQISDCDYKKKFRKVDTELESLLYSAEKFPPILALSISKAEKRIHEVSNLDQGLGIFNEELKKMLKDGNNINYCFLKSLVDEVGYRKKDEYYWIISSDNNNSVLWVSDDYQIYSDSMIEFE